MRSAGKFRLVITLLLLVLLIVSSGLAADYSKKIGVLLLTREHFFFRELEAGLTIEAKQYSFKPLILYGEFDHNRQVAQIDELIAKKCDALILSPCDSIKIGDAILKANRARIPVFTVDIANRSGKGRIVAHIASDNFEGGRQAGKLMAAALKGKGKVVIINHPNVTSVMDRVAGFKSFLQAYPRIEIISDIPAWGQRDRAMAIMEDLLLMLPDLNGVFAINDDSALGAAKAIEAAGRTGEITVIGYDATPEAQMAIEKGKIYGEVVQFPREMGRLVIRTVKDYFDGKKVLPLIPVHVGVISREKRKN